MLLYYTIPYMDLAEIRRFEQKIVILREQKVMLGTDLAQLYGVETKVLMQAVRRNIKRFLEDFTFMVGNQDVISLRSQIVTLSEKHWRYKPYTFTEQGVAINCAGGKEESKDRVYFLTRAVICFTIFSAVIPKCLYNS